MSHELDAPPLYLTSNTDGSRLVVGCVDGSVRLFDTTGEDFEEIWRFECKASIRGVAINETTDQVYAVVKNKATCVFDINTGQRTRCLLRSHKSAPSAICYLPPSSLKNQQLATADESGAVKTWDMRVADPVVRSWKNQEEEINDLKLDRKHNLLAASSDGTLAAYDVRKGKLRVKSEMMHSDLQSICPTDNFVYVGGGDGYIEVFKLNEYGNLLERIESGFDMGVSGIVELRTGLLLTTSSGSNEMRLLNVMPSKRLGICGEHGEDKNDGIDAIAISGDRSRVFTVISLSASLHKWDMKPVVDKVPILRATDAKTKKHINAGFFDDLLTDADREPAKKKKRRAAESSDDDDDEGDSGEDDDDEAEDEDEQEDEEEEDSDDN